MIDATGNPQTILLLGGTSDIGLAIVTELLAAERRPVLLAARASSPRLAKAKARVESAGATCVQVLDSDRLSNPNGVADDDFIRGGVEKDRYNAPIAYHFRNAHPGDVLGSTSKSMTWERVDRADALAAAVKG